MARLIFFPSYTAGAEFVAQKSHGLLCALVTEEGCGYVRPVRLLNRYLLRLLALPLLYCLAAFWLMAALYDLFSERLGQFLDWGVNFGFALRYYALTAPEILLQALPLALLLALLYSLSLLSKHRELNAIRASGQSLRRTTTPLLALGALLSIASLVANETLAFRAAESARQMVEHQRLREADAQSPAANPAKHRTPELNARIAHTRRFWHARHFDVDTYEMREVIVGQETPDGRSDEYRIHARTARWLDGEWWFFDGEIADYTQARLSVPRRLAFRELRRADFTETPRLLLMELRQVRPSEMSLAELGNYVRLNASKSRRALAPYRTQWHARLAQPWGCLVVALLAVPLGASFSRRGPLMATAIAITLALAFWLVTRLIIPFGEHGRIEPWLASWLPYAVFGAVGAALYARMD